MRMPGGNRMVSRRRGVGRVQSVPHHQATDYEHARKARYQLFTRSHPAHFLLFFVLFFFSSFSSSRRG
jgi:hypothetical protein